MDGNHIEKEVEENNISDKIVENSESIDESTTYILLDEYRDPVVIDEENPTTGMKGKHENIERDLEDFLRLGHKHNVWKEIKATKAEIKKMEKNIKKEKKRKVKRQEGRNQ